MFPVKLFRSSLKELPGQPTKTEDPFFFLVVLAHFYQFSNISNFSFYFDSRGTFENLPSGIYMLHLRNGGQVKPTEQTGV